MFRQEVRSVGLSIERGTETVPDDGFYHVILLGEIVFRSRSQARALEEYRKQRDRLLGAGATAKLKIDAVEALRRQRLLRDLDALRGEARLSKRKKALKRGGKGGTGGVG